MAPRFTVDPVPTFVAGIMTVRCECGWEMVFMVPEEYMLLVVTIFRHMTDGHKLELPEFRCESH